MSNFQRIVLVHYHEIGLKGHNRSKFETRLVRNIESLTSRFSINNVKRMSGRIVIYLRNEAERSEQLEIAKFVAKIPGVQRTSAGFRAEADYELLKELAITALDDVEDFESFKVQARRNHTDFEPDSMTMNREIGAVLCKRYPDKKVIMKNPDVVVSVEVVQNQSFVCAATFVGIGGLPAGVSGNVMCLLSNGIDSPVATWMMAKRGATCSAVHFSGRPQTSDASEYLVADIANKLAETGCIKQFWVCPIGDYQRKIALSCPQELRVILYRRLMFRVADALANLVGAKAIVTGESLGQVASQTLANMVATSDVTDKLVLRPLIGLDKLEIINLAEKIETFEISSQDAPDCCTLFMPRSPETHAKLDIVRKAEEEYFNQSWVDEIIENAELHKL